VTHHKDTVYVIPVDKVEIFNVEDFCDIANVTIVCEKFGFLERHAHQEIHRFLSSNGIL